MEEKKRIEVLVDGRKRVDKYIQIKTGLSRAKIQRMIDNHSVTVNSKPVKSYHVKVGPGDYIEYTEEVAPPREVKPADIPLEIIYEDKDLLVINKQAGLVTHPAPGHWDDTLVNALIGRHVDAESYRSKTERYGIVHRLDRDTSGAMVIARNEDVHRKLVSLFKKKEVVKIYRCLVHGELARDGEIDANIVRDIKDRKKFTARQAGGKEALTLYTPVETFPQATFLSVKIITGRTHQIRVHMKHIRHEVIGDSVYGSSGKDEQLAVYLGYDKKSAIDLMPRQMLHAYSLSFTHPVTGKAMEFEAPLPADFKKLLEMLIGRAG